MIYNYDKTLADPRSVIFSALGSVNDPINLSNGRYYSPKMLGSKTEIIDINSGRYRPFHPRYYPRFRNTNLFYEKNEPRLFTYPCEEGVWITFRHCGCLVAQHFDQEMVSDQFLIYTDDPEVIFAYKEYLSSPRHEEFVGLGVYEWVLSNNDYIEEFIWFESFEHYYIMNFSKENRYYDRFRPYDSLPENEAFSVFNFVIPDRM